MATRATSNKQARWHRPTWRSGAGLALSAMALSMLVVAPVSAQSGCGDYSYGFEGTRLLNDGISNSSGPFGIDLPAGIYTVTLVAHDHHSTQPDIPSQANEQYQVVLDSGYVSPASIDIPDGADTTTTVFTGQVIGQSNAISVQHIGAPGINSVNVVCVGFTIEAAIVEPVPPLVAEPAPADIPTEDAAVEEPADDKPADAKDAPTDPVAPTTPEEGPAAELPAIPEDVVQDIGDPVGIIRNPDVPAPDAAPPEAPPATVAASPSPEPPAEEPTVQVAGITLVQDTETEAQVPLLAITGPGTGAIALTGFGLLFLSVGLMFLQSERHLSRRP